MQWNSSELDALADEFQAKVGAKLGIDFSKWVTSLSFIKNFTFQGSVLKNWHFKEVKMIMKSTDK